MIPILSKEFDDSANQGAKWLNHYGGKYRAFCRFVD